MCVDFTYLRGVIIQGVAFCVAKLCMMDVKSVKSFTRKQLALKLYDNFCGEMERDEYTVLFLNHLKGQNMYSNCVTGH